MMTYHLNILQLELIGRLDILGLPDVRHVAPVVHAILVVGGLAGVEDEVVNPLASENLGQVVHLARSGGMPLEVDVGSDSQGRNSQSQGDDAGTLGREDSHCGIGDVEQGIRAKHWVFLSKQQADADQGRKRKVAIQARDICIKWELQSHLHSFANAT